MFKPFSLSGKIKIYIFFICLVLQTNIYPQYFLNDPAPLQPGNYWLYSDYYGSKYSYRVIDSAVIVDHSLYYLIEYKSPNGSNFYIGYQYNRLDSNNFYIRYNNALFSNPEVKYYKKGALLNESWTNTFSGDLRTAYYRIIDTGTTTWNGNYTKIKVLDITDSALVEQYQYWSEDFGLVQVSDFESGPDFLIACIINGNVYGDTTFTDIKEKNKNAPQNFYLSQNYPNPFNPTTKIDINIFKTGFVSLKVFDILGREISTLINKELKPGSYTVDFNGNKLSSGVYIYVLKTSEYINVKKMILLM